MTSIKSPYNQFYTSFILHFEMELDILKLAQFSHHHEYQLQKFKSDGSPCFRSWWLTQNDCNKYVSLKMYIKAYTLLSV